MNILKNGNIHLLPLIAGFVGADTMGVILSSKIYEENELNLAIDIGTNGELVIGNNDWLMTCACSAGPAFEGSGIKCGIPAVDGAIEQMLIKNNEEIQYKVIGSIKPKGLCGSGLVDLLAELFAHDYIDRYGKFKTENIKERLVKTESGKGFVVEQSYNSYWGKDIIITENDIANIIRTKAAVFSASSLLIKNIGINFDQIEAFLIAGGFGQNLNIENAIRIGLFPDIARQKFHYLGNSSLWGAYLILICDKNRDIVNEVSEKMTYIELNTEPRYMNEYTGALFLPHTDMNLFPSVKDLKAKTKDKL